MNTIDSFLNNIISIPDCLCNIINCFPDALKLSLTFKCLPFSAFNRCCWLAAFFITMLMVYTDGICYIANNLSHSHSSPSTPSIPPVLFITVFPIFFSLHLQQLGLLLLLLLVVEWVFLTVERLLLLLFVLLGFKEKGLETNLQSEIAKR